MSDDGTPEPLPPWPKAWADALMAIDAEPGNPQTRLEAARMVYDAIGQGATLDQRRVMAGFVVNQFVRAGRYQDAVDMAVALASYGELVQLHARRALTLRDLGAAGFIFTVDWAATGEAVDEESVVVRLLHVAA